ncbi:MAG: putative cation membrane transporter [halophilic archaeon J07HX5]|nr:MAG: putative cation membrane transporter [halophilic archaeon J07HX5]
MFENCLSAASPTTSMQSYLALVGAILAEVTGTTLLKLSDGFDNAAFGVGAMALYLIAFYFVSEALADLPVGLVYATWSAVGILALAVIGVTVFRESVDAAGLAGFVLIVAGVVLLNVYSTAYSPA